MCQMPDLSWHATVAGLVEALAPNGEAYSVPDDDLLALGRELAACAAVEEIIADARLAGWRRSHG